MNKTIGTLIAAGLLGFAGSTAFAAEESKPWKESAELSVVSTNGNSKATSISGKNTFEYKKERAHLEVNAGGLGTESEDRTIAEQYYANEKFSWDLIGRNYSFERFGWDKDRFAGVEHRYDASAGLGRHFFEEKARNQLMLELGGGYIHEQRATPPRNEFGAGRAYSKYEFAITETSKFSQDAEFTHNFKDSDDYRLTTITALQAAISTHMSLKVSYTWKRVGKPPVGIGRDDTITAVALIVSY